ncbi:Protoporphyrin uptake protein 1 [Cyphellophora attinorum]|uniref:Protoporphyrin uptake protein 1 n=1 Tax=Cyphellophora attinorum TaxID=1664694 RepID=A0A0N1H9A5_9EURO|nr:Protoporphyrin uptake protein 1 [Phialophora attinorum]KPI38704.1 Protoporphyrin uptake protein 1 [Phialophora attinorum]
MAKLECYPVDDPDTLWLYCPSFPAAIAYSVLFGLTTTAHLVQAFIHRKPFAWVLIMGSLWETAGYILRILAVIDQRSETYQTYQQLLIILAPLWINAFCYMVLGRMLHCFLPPGEDKVWGVRARKIALLFVWGDVFSFIIQLGGGLMINNEYGAKTVRLGINIYMAGVGVQLCFIAAFMAIAVRFQLTIRQGGVYNSIDHSDSSSMVELTGPHGSQHMTLPSVYQIPPTRRKNYSRPMSTRRVENLLYALYSVLLLIIFRNLYRLIEFSSGAESSITKREYYTFVFDSTPMLLALLVFNAFHPGRFLRGPRADFSAENKELKEQKRATRRAKKEADQLAKEERKAAKQTRRAAKGGRSEGTFQDPESHFIAK